MACLNNLDAIRTTNDTDQRKSTPLFCNGIERLQFNDKKLINEQKANET